MILAASTLGTILATVAAFLLVTLLLVSLLLFVKQKLNFEICKYNLSYRT